MNIHIYHHYPDRDEISKQLLLIIKNQKTMSEALDALKAKFTEQSGKLDTISTSVSGIAEDVAALKAKIGTLSGGATAEEIAELSTLVDGVGAKVDAIGTATADLDAQTDPTNV